MGVASRQASRHFWVRRRRITSGKGAGEAGDWDEDGDWGDEEEDEEEEEADDTGLEGEDEGEDGVSRGPGGVVGPDGVGR